MTHESLSPEPDAVALNNLFQALADFNAAEPADRRFGDAVVYGLHRSNQRKALEGEGMTPDEAIAYIKATQGDRSPAEENVAMDHGLLQIAHQPALETFGLEISGDLLTDAHVVITDADRLVSNLQRLQETEGTPAIKSGLTAMIKQFVDSLPYDVIANHYDEVTRLGGRPFWMRSVPVVDEEKQRRIEETLSRGKDIAAACTKFGVDEKVAQELRTVTTLRDENLLIEWSIVSDWGCYYEPWGDDAGLAHWRRNWETPEDWSVFFRLLDHVKAKSPPDSDFLPHLRDTMVDNLTAYLCAIRAGKISIDKSNELAMLPKDEAELHFMIDAEKDQRIGDALALRARIAAY